MKKLLLLTFVMLTMPTFAQQISLYDRNGEAKAYIDFNENATIYLWDGTPVAYIQNGNH